MSGDLTKELLSLKQRIEADKEKKARLEGKLASLMDRLKKEFDCESVPQAEKKLKKLNSQIKELEEQVRGKIDIIQREYAARA